MEMQTKQAVLWHEPGELAVLGAFADAPLPDEVAALFEGADFAGKAGQTLLLYPRGALAPRRLLLLGLGPGADVTAETIRRAAATAVRQARDLQVKALSIALAAGGAPAATAAAQALAEGLELGAYRYWRYRTGLSEAQTFVVEGATICTEGEAEAVATGAARGQAIARGVILARDLVNTPGYALTPALMAEEAVALGARAGLQTQVLDLEQLREGGFGGIIAVGQGSANEPRFIIMEHGRPGPDTPTICLVGKGLTFDSGGLSIKPADGMDTMKSDMGGAAAVFGALQVAAALDLPLHVVGLVSAAENMPSGTAYRPGDVVTTLSGKTVEVLNTDAEGRIILADALHYAQRYEPAGIIELSTLTGAIIIALGPHAIGMTATDQALADAVLAAGERSGERVWQLPLWDEYHEMIKSEIADVKNLGGRPAGSITAGAFLATFTGDYPFVHLDVAGTAWADKASKPYEVPGGTGVGVRLLTQYLRDYAK